MRSGGRRSATAPTVARSKRRFRAKTKTNSVLALTAPTLAPSHPSLCFVFFPFFRAVRICWAAARSEQQITPTRQKWGFSMLGTSNGNSKIKATSASLARASVDVLIQAIESGHHEVFSSYLETMARFHTYSARNVLLIAAQRPDATRLEGVRSWNELGRFVRPGEKGIFIFAPAVGFTKKPSQAAEENGRKPKGKKAAEPVSQPPEQEAHLLGFRGVWVFDISQTGGEELPEPHPQFDAAEKLASLLAFAESRQMKIEYTEKIAPAKGASYRGLIRLLSGMEPAEAFPVLLREVTSQLLYQAERRTFVTRALHQQETKAAAFVVCDALELSSKSSFADCQLYYGDARLLRESLEVVHRTAAQILGALSPKDEAQSTQEVR
jgi:hypothetical protein